MSNEITSTSSDFFKTITKEEYSSDPEKYLVCNGKALTFDHYNEVTRNNILNAIKTYYRQHCFMDITADNVKFNSSTPIGNPIDGVMCDPSMVFTNSWTNTNPLKQFLSDPGRSDNFFIEFSRVEDWALMALSAVDIQIRLPLDYTNSSQNKLKKYNDPLKNTEVPIPKKIQIFGKNGSPNWRAVTRVIEIDQEEYNYLIPIHINLREHGADNTFYNAYKIVVHEWNPEYAAPYDSYLGVANVFCQFGSIVVTEIDKKVIVKIYQTPENEDELIVIDVTPYLNAEADALSEELAEIKTGINNSVEVNLDVVGKLVSEKFEELKNVNSEELAQLVSDERISSYVRTLVSEKVIDITDKSVDLSTLMRGTFMNGAVREVSSAEYISPIDETGNIIEDVNKLKTDLVSVSGDVLDIKKQLETNYTTLDEKIKKLGEKHSDERISSYVETLVTEKVTIIADKFEEIKTGINNSVEVDPEVVVKLVSEKFEELKNVNSEELAQLVSVIEKTKNNLLTLKDNVFKEQDQYKELVKVVNERIEEFNSNLSVSTKSKETENTHVTSNNQILDVFVDEDHVNVVTENTIVKNNTGSEYVVVAKDNVTNIYLPELPPIGKYLNITNFKKNGAVHILPNSNNSISVAYKGGYYTDLELIDLDSFSEKATLVFDGEGWVGKVEQGVKLK